METLVIVCAGGCGKTTEDVNPYEFWAGEVKQSDDPEERVPIWTCKECVEKRLSAGQERKEKIEDIASIIISRQGRVIDEENCENCHDWDGEQCEHADFDNTLQIGEDPICPQDWQYALSLAEEIYKEIKQG